MIGCGITLAVVALLVLIIFFSLVALFTCGTQEERAASSLSPSEPMTIEGLKLVVNGFEMTDRPAQEPPGVTHTHPGTKFLWVHINAEGVGETDFFRPVFVRIEYRGEDLESSIILQSALQDPTHPLFSAVGLSRGESAAGWKLFEVPLDLDPAEVAVLLKVGEYDPKVASWCLVEPKNEDVC